MSDLHILLTILIAAAVTALIRALPFLAFRGGRKPPEFIVWLGTQLPRAVMMMLVVYCLKDVSFTTRAGFIPAFAGVAAAAALHVWKRQMLLSVAGSTAVYMLLLRLM